MRRTSGRPPAPNGAGRERRRTEIGLPLPSSCRFHPTSTRRRTNGPWQAEAAGAVAEDTKLSRLPDSVNPRLFRDDRAYGTLMERLPSPSRSPARSRRMASSQPSLSTSPAEQQPLASPAVLGRGLAVLRIFVGIIFFANGLAKVTGERNITIGWYRGFLIVRNEARNILQFEVNERGGSGTGVPYLKDVVNDLILPNW